MHLELLSDTVENRRRVQQIFEAAPKYSILTEGHLPLPNAGDEAFETVAPNGSVDQKRVFAIRLDGNDIGVADLYLGWNTSAKVCIGLLLLIESQHRNGFGTQAFVMLRDEIAGWKQFTHIRIGVVQTNTSAFPFWKSLGFVETGEVKTGESFIAPITILERQI